MFALIGNNELLERQLIMLQLKNNKNKKYRIAMGFLKKHLNF